MLATNLRTSSGTLASAGLIVVVFAATIYRAQQQSIGSVYVPQGGPGIAPPPPQYAPQPVYNADPYASFNPQPAPVPPPAQAAAPNPPARPWQQQQQPSWQQQRQDAPFIAEPTPANQCTSQMQQQIRTVCARELETIYGVFPGAVSSTPMTWDGLRRKQKLTFQQICTAFDNWDRCVSPFKAYCFFTEPIKAQYTVTHEMLNYLCRPPAYQDMVTNWDCYQMAQNRGDLATCDQQIIAAARGGTALNLRDENTCRILQDYVNCVKKPIWEQCGHRAWSHVREAFQKPTQVYLPFCTLAAATLKLPTILQLLVAALSSLFLRQLM